LNDGKRLVFSRIAQSSTLFRINGGFSRACHFDCIQVDDFACFGIYFGRDAIAIPPRNIPGVLELENPPMEFIGAPFAN
jgi:hypothetical protein